jgi:hypothetical protein
MAIEINTSAGNTIEVTQSDGTSVTFNQETSSVSVSSPASTSVQVLEKGVKGDKGDTGPQGEVGPGVASGGTENQFLQKNSATDYDTKWSAYSFPAADGDDNQVLVTDGAGTLTFDHVRSTRITIRNDEGATIPAGTPVYSKGEVGGSERILVGIADASDPAKMPAIGIAETTLNTTSTQDGYAIMSGVFNTNVSGFTGLSEGDILYVSNSGGGLSQTKPTGTYLIQNIGIVLKTNGTILQGFQVSCIGRTNDIPNIATGNIWAGNASGVATATSVAYIDIANERVGIGTSSPSTKLEVNGGVTASGPIESSDGTNTSLTSETARFNKFGLMANRSSLYITNENASGSMQFGIGGVHAAATKMYLSSDGKLAVGTTSPASPLHVYSDNAVTSNNGGLTIEQDGTGDALLQFLLTGSKRWVVGIDNDANNNFKISGTSDLGTDNGLTIANSTYNVGIGTTSPSYRLDVNAGTDNVVSSFASTDAVAQLRIVDSSSTPFYFGVSGTTGYISATGAAPQNGLAVKNTGNVGIGTSSPSAKLDVVGLANINDGSDNVMISSNNTALTTGTNNTAVGYEAGYSNTTGSNNIAIGRNAGYHATGSNNALVGYYAGHGASGASTFSNAVALGYQALQSLTTGSSNTGLGYRALASNLTGGNNTAVGNIAGVNITGGNNTVMGFAAGQDITSGSNTAMGWRAGEDVGSDNTMVGREAGRFTTSSNNVAIGSYAAKGVQATSTFSNTVAVGYQALTALTTGISNTSVGHQALTNVTTASSNTAVGYNAGFATISNGSNSFVGAYAGANSTGSSNTAVGFGANYYNTTGSNNVAIGRDAAYGASGASTFSNTVAVGYQALTALTTGGTNTAVGYQAGYSNSTGSGNVFIGYQAGYNETGSNKLYIANSNTTTPLIYGDFNLGEITINGDLNVSGGNLKADAIEISGRAMTTPATGEYGSGSKLVTQFATGTVTAGKVYVANAGAWAEGDADAGSTSIGMIAVATDAASATEMLIEGVIKLSSNTGFSGASAGDVLYLSTTAGELTTTAPSAAGDYVRVCGYVVSASTNEVFFASLIIQYFKNGLRFYF